MSCCCSVVGDLLLAATLQHSHLLFPTYEWDHTQAFTDKVPSVTVSITYTTFPSQFDFTVCKTLIMVLQRSLWDILYCAVFSKVVVNSLYVQPHATADAKILQCR